VSPVSPGPGTNDKIGDASGPVLGGGVVVVVDAGGALRSAGWLLIVTVTVSVEVIWKVGGVSRPAKLDGPPLTE
jgi:hypothetical protein